MTYPSLSCWLTKNISNTTLPSNLFLLFQFFINIDIGSDFLLFGMIYFIEMFLLERAKELADIVGADALTLADLNNFHPEDGMILANTTSIGMQPKVDETPISKVCILLMFFF